ncbi:MAG: hypothetical protein WCX77_03350 [Candidatus Paceibacterota bacterium]|jgi:Tfp pilus assembly protein PilN
MAIEVASQKEGKPLWQTLLFYFSFILLVLSLALFLALNVYFVPKLEKETKGITAQIASQGQSVDSGKKISEMEAEVKAAETKLKDFETLYKGNLRASKFFQEFEGAVHPKAYFTSLSLTLKSDEPKAVLSGQTESYQSLIQQIEILQSKDFIKNFDISNIGSAGDKEVSFVLTLNLQPSIFK